MDLTTGQNLLKEKKFFLAKKYFEKLLNLNPNKPEINFYLGRVYSELLDSINSIKYYKRYLEFNENSINCLINLGIIYLNIGDIINSEKTFRKIINLNKKNITAFNGLFMLSQELLKEKDFDYLENILSDDKEISLTDKSIIYFLLSKNERKKKNIQKELTFLKNYHLQSFNSNLQYNNQSIFFYKNFLGKFNDKINYINNYSLKELKPIFIVGLPRSGSTLIESILTSGDVKIKTYGESNFINSAIIDQIKAKIFKKNFKIENIDLKIDLSKIMEFLEDRYSFKNNTLTEEFFVDKSLENIFNIELILKIFPGAKFIHSKRKLKDAILSIYFSMLPELSWTLSMDTIKDYVNKYEKIVVYYKKKFPDKILDIDLDEFTSNPNLISKEIYDFCCLSWNKKYLNFYKRNNLFSKTLSSTQIRKQISKQNQSNYSNYYFLLD